MIPFTNISETFLDALASVVEEHERAKGLIVNEFGARILIQDSERRTIKRISSFDIISLLKEGGR
jgi:hypothetical protein